GLDPRIVLGDPLAATERGLALVAALGVDARKLDHDQALVIHHSRMKTSVRSWSRTRHHISLLLPRARSTLSVGPRLMLIRPANSTPSVDRPEMITRTRKIVLSVMTT